MDTPNTLEAIVHQLEGGQLVFDTADLRKLLEEQLGFRRSAQVEMFRPGGAYDAFRAIVDAAGTENFTVAVTTRYGASAFGRTAVRLDVWPSGSEDAKLAKVEHLATVLSDRAEEMKRSLKEAQALIEKTVEKNSAIDSCYSDVSSELSEAATSIDDASDHLTRATTTIRKAQESRSQARLSLEDAIAQGYPELAPDQSQKAWMVETGTGGTLLHEAVNQGQMASIPREILTAENLAKQNSDGDTVYHLAADMHSLRDIPAEAFDAAAMGIQNKRGETVWHVAAAQKCLHHIPDRVIEQAPFRQLLVQSIDGITAISAIVGAAAGGVQSVPDRLWARIPPELMLMRMPDGRTLLEFADGMGVSVPEPLRKAVKATQELYRSFDHSKFDNYEVDCCALAGVAGDGVETLEPCEPDDPNLAAWTVYGHLKPTGPNGEFGGCEAVSDHTTEGEAMQEHGRLSAALAARRERAAAAAKSQPDMPPLPSLQKPTAGRSNGR